MDKNNTPFALFHETIVLTDDLSLFFLLLLFYNSNEKWHFKWLIKSKVARYGKEIFISAR